MQRPEAQQLPREREDKGCPPSAAAWVQPGRRVQAKLGATGPQKNKIPRAYGIPVLFLLFAVGKTTLTDSCDK